MTLNANKIKTGGANRNWPDPLEPGAYEARVVQVLGLGLQEQRPYQGKPKDPKQEVKIVYELPYETAPFAKDGEQVDLPRWIGETFPLYPLDADLAKSTKRYFAIDPKGEAQGDFSQLIGMPCMVNIVLNENNGRTYENISSVAVMRSKLAENLPELSKEGKVFDFDEPDLEVFLSLPQGTQDYIKRALNYGGSTLEALVENHESKATESKPKSKPQVEDADDQSDEEAW